MFVPSWPRAKALNKRFIVMISCFDELPISSNLTGGFYFCLVVTEISTQVEDRQQYLEATLGLHGHHHGSISRQGPTRAIAFCSFSDTKF